MFSFFTCQTCHASDSGSGPNVSVESMNEEIYGENPSAAPTLLTQGRKTVDVCEASLQKQITPASATSSEVRTGLDGAVLPDDALEALKSGNQRYTGGFQRQETIGAPERKALVNHGQKPMAIVIGCADSRAPIDIIFDARPGDLFGLRNAGNTCTRAEGSIVGSVEYAISALDSKLVFVLGHTKCGALAGATKVMLAQRAEALTDGPSKLSAGKSALDILLSGLVPVAKEAAEQLQDASEQEIAARAVEVNVRHTMAQLLQYSPGLRGMVESGEVQVHGGIYDLETGEVEFLGQHPDQHELLQKHMEVVAAHAQ